VARIGEGIRGRVEEAIVRGDEGREAEAEVGLKRAMCSEQG
jgi:hypothetical protein